MMVKIQSNKVFKVLLYEILATSFHSNVLGVKAIDHLVPHKSHTPFRPHWFLLTFSRGNPFYFFPSDSKGILPCKWEMGQIKEKRMNKDVKESVQVAEHGEGQVG